MSSERETERKTKKTLWRKHDFSNKVVLIQFQGVILHCPSSIGISGSAKYLGVGKIRVPHFLPTTGAAGEK